MTAATETTAESGDGCATRSRSQASRGEGRAALDIASGFPRTLYLFKPGRKGRLASGRPFPSDQFYGFPEIEARGHPVAILEEDEIRAMAEPSGRAERALARMLARLLHRIPAALGFAVTLAQRPVRHRLQGFDALVATTTTQGFCLALLRRLGLIDRRILFIAMGIDLDAVPWHERALARWLLGACEVLPLAEAEARALARHLAPRHPIRVLPLGASLGFWQTAPRPETGVAEHFVFTIGKDRHRDFQMLADGWQAHYPLLRMVTGLPVRCDKPNVEIIRGEWQCQAVTDDEVRRLFQQCLFVVVPIRDTIQPAGQSASLAAMACGKAVIVSDIRGLWNREVMRDGETCLLVRPGSVEAMQAAVERLLADPDLVARLGARAREVVEGQLNTDVASRVMEMILATPTKAV